jgi:hypothetical protein
MEDSGILMAIYHIVHFLHYGIFFGHLVYLARFSILCPAKSGNPEPYRTDEFYWNIFPGTTFGAFLEHE